MVVEPISPGSSSATTESADHDSSDPHLDAAREEAAALGTDDVELRRGDWGPKARAAMRARVIAEMPAWYSPLAHFLFPAAFGVGVIYTCAHLVTSLHPLELLTIPLTLLLSNAIEWHAHRDILHKRTRLAPMLYERHTPVHHKLFTTDDMAITDWRELRNVMLPAFGVIAILSLQVPLVALAFLFGLRNVALLFMATSMAYVLMYEWLHLAYHLPEGSFIGRRPLVKWLARHHALHHDPKLMQRWNMNVTVPLWDWLSGSIYDPKHAVGPDRPDGARSATAAPGANADSLHRST